MKHKNTAEGPEAAKSTVVAATVSQTKSPSPILNEYSVIMECQSKDCNYETAVYGQGDLDMWDDERCGYPECPVCRSSILVKSKRQYLEL
jgi:hypothetical protein